MYVNGIINLDFKFKYLLWQTDVSSFSCCFVLTYIVDSDCTDILIFDTLMDSLDVLLQSIFSCGFVLTLITNALHPHGQSSCVSSDFLFWILCIDIDGTDI